MHTSSIAVVAAALLLGCGGSDATPADSTTLGTTDSAAASAGGAGMDSATRADTAGGAMVAAATAAVKDAAGRDLGTLTIADNAGGLTISGTLRGLTPGEHGIHIHTVGKCEGPAFTSAGGHWNPDSTKHGAQNPQGPHRGDLMNLTVGADSSATVQASVTRGSLRGAEMLLDADGAALVVHAKADDNKTDPSGNSGDRIACGVISGS